MLENLKEEQRKILNPYFCSFYCNNVSIFLTHPVERIKFAVHLDIQTPQASILKSFLTSRYKELYTGFTPSFIKQNIQIIPWVFSMTTIPQWIDGCNFNIFFGVGIKGLIASTISTLVGSPCENIAMQQIIANPADNPSFVNAAKSIYHHNGLPGYFLGTVPTIVKSLPNWIYLFFGYTVIKDKKEPDNFLSTVKYATAASIPLSVITTPPDLVKSRIQAGLLPKDQSIFSAVKHIAKHVGIFAPWRGLPLRVLNKSLVTTTGYLVLDQGKKSEPDSNSGFKP